MESCSDSLTTDPKKKPPWPVRKEKYIKHVAGASADALLVSLADKLHNARAISRDQHRLGDALFSRFTMGKDDAAAGREATAWYYDELTTAFENRRAELTPEGRLLVSELRDLVAGIRDHPTTPTADEGVRTA